MVFVVCFWKEPFARLICLWQEYVVFVSRFALGPQRPLVPFWSFLCFCSCCYCHCSGCGGLGICGRVPTCCWPRSADTYTSYPTAWAVLKQLFPKSICLGPHQPATLSAAATLTSPGFRGRSSIRRPKRERSNLRCCRPKAGFATAGCLRVSFWSVEK